MESCNEIFHLFFHATSENKDKRPVGFGEAKIFTGILLAVILCSTTKTFCKKNALILCYLYV